jgi:Thioredoxin
METLTQLVEASVWNNAILYADYRKLIDTLLLAGKITSGEATEHMLHYTKLNLQRMNRIEKTFVPETTTLNFFSALKKPNKWLIIAEGWCGDAAQTLPVISKLASLNSLIDLRIVLRDQHLDLMDQHLTNGTRSIPKLLIMDEHNLVLETWGPRPLEAKNMVLDFKAKGLPHDEWVEKVHAWYAKDKGKSTEREIVYIIEKLF